MAIRLATFNVENLFERAKALDTTTWAEGEPVLAAYGRFTTLSAKTVYTDDDKQDMLQALEILQVLVRDQSGRLVLNPRPFEAWALLRENRGDFLKQPAGGDAVIVAGGRGDWIGWVDLITEPVDENATRMTAKVINDVAADILCLVEAEHRPSLVRFNAALLDRHYAHAMLVDGNDPRGIDVGLMTTARVSIESVHSHVDDPDPQSDTGRALFSRDCPVYQLRLPGGRELFLLLNHFKSQSFSSGDPDPLRRRQATRVREIYDRLRTDGAELVAVLGDLNKGPTNDTPPQHPTLEPLLGPGTPLVDTADLPGFDTGPRPGTFQSCSLRNRLDYILVSPELADLTTTGGVFRTGLWGDPDNTNPPQQWDIYPEITSSRHSASDHAAVWIDLNL
ncbi:endonuclease/exonuclease/phosphatase family protein [Saccharothrix luteola]|uniref:endonuclease/exonuclease/phosphatase family protein n=1 Tax=Saccharothrix luteola TaxID=2893018 RepID=UPI001E56FC11|nr:endonuclease/exonuclease/phosphatase family protein [Saccharothrix luteola]MCC8244982.1 endonuclease/exonuclease/phosphatase family protein [Saccharothrix luteola]